MKKFLRHKIILRVLLCSVLALLIADVCWPRIEQYNQDVQSEQQKKFAEAQGIDYFTISDDRVFTDPFDLFAVVLTALFVALILTNRIFQSFLFFIFFTWLYFLAIYEFRKNNLYLITHDYHFVRSIYFDMLLTALLIAVASFMAALISRPFYKMKSDC